ncbi:MAG TPA: hypothetical protein VF846_10625 [Thermoanaerobaculia bacterium]|jgi:hypothetical protein
MAMLRSLVLFAALLAGAALSAQTCESTTPELAAAIDIVHELKGKPAADAVKVVDEWLPRIVLALARVGELEDAWLHLGVDVSRQLVRLERKDDARRLLTQIASRESDSNWKKTANDELQKLDQRGSM